MPRYRITIEYDGGNFAGWQRQDNGPSVQAALEDAAAAITGKPDRVVIHGAGRTDAGVHATGQVAHFDLPRDFDAVRLPLALNAHLPEEVRVLDAEAVGDDFNARFDAISRSYRYRIWTRRIAPALDKARVGAVCAELDVGAMEAAAQLLLGKHDFTSFRATYCQAASAVKTLDVLRFEEEEYGYGLVAEARSFLHHQVRIIAGTLIEVGRGKWYPDQVQAALEARDRAAAGPTAPAEGLYLTRVDYP